MQIYLTSDDPELMPQFENALREKELSEWVSCELLSSEFQGNLRNSPADALNLTMILVTVLGVGGAGTVLIHKLARVLEVLINSKKVEVKIQGEKEIVELSGSAGHIEKMLKIVQ